MATIGRLAHRPAMTIACLSTVVLGLGGSLTAGVAASDDSWYRYVLELRSGDLRYVEPLGPAVVEGRRYRVQEARYAYDGQPIFTLVYGRLADGRVVRSVARGPDGAVWAEYPDVYVEYVEPTGEAVDRPGVAKIYRKGPWWPAPAGLRVDRVDRAPARGRDGLGARAAARPSVHPLVVVPRRALDALVAPGDVALL